jgi:hypothetical protein
MLRISEEEETTALTSTSLSEQGYKEEDLREWILESPHSLLGEDILVIGREVEVQDIGDGIDLLGIDRDGNIVVIELKKGSLTGTVDFQSLKYAAYASYWEWGQLSDQFEKFAESTWGEGLYEEDVDFNEKLESFCNDEYELNGNQRILLVGEGIRKRLDLVVRWLSERDVEISVLDVAMLEDNDQLYLDTEQIIPVPENTVSGVRINTIKEPWKKDGERWHREEKLKDDTAEVLQEVVDALGNIDSIDGPSWRQKQYVSFKQNKKNRIVLRTRTEVFKIKIYDIATGDIDLEALADAVGVSSGAVDLLGERQGIRITCDGDSNINTERLVEKVEEYLAEW